ncbi:hypothetical protein L6164_029354 [Bauhinia variegata]|uniref:Uncharacterized protein n=1 Tax=Bauhinia variegata TaxID=167791 RepID=A0ACB9L8G5_BAUVA|nr:hypothetical protein L6164_029354 [Bauhinia variegata]
MRYFTIEIANAFRNFSTKSSPKKPSWFYKKQNAKGKPKEKKQSKPKIEWTDEQKSVFSAIAEGKSVFITGSAGTGKTLLLQGVIKELRKMYKPSKVSVTASTGIAAFALKGQTLHSFAGIGISSDNRQEKLHRILDNKRACRRWINVEALVIDEISMIDAELFDDIDYIARNIREVDAIWGGIQLVVSGDFFQLPPVPDKRNRKSGVMYAFEADCWDESFDLQVELTKIFRQLDCRLIKLLQGIRTGETDPQDLKLLEECCLERDYDPSAVKLFPLNGDVTKVNEERLQSLQKDVVVYKAVDTGPWKSQLSLGMAPGEISICEGARVMLVKNLNTWKGLVNGATGTVVGFSESEDTNDIFPNKLLPIVQFDSGTTVLIKPQLWHVMDGDVVVAERKQIPLILAWALSIHKCQGMTLEKVYSDLSRAFGFGMVYVALSRVRSLEGLHLSGFDSSKIKADPKVQEFYKNFASRQKKEHLDDSCNKREDCTDSIIGVAEKLSPAGPKQWFSLSQFLSTLLKRS